MNRAGELARGSRRFRVSFGACRLRLISTCRPSPRTSATPSPRCCASIALKGETASLKEIVKRLEHLVAELNHVVHGKKSEKLSEDDRQLAFEDLEVAVADVEEQQDSRTSSDDAARRKSSPAKRNRGNLPEDPAADRAGRRARQPRCARGCGQMHRIGEDRTERLDIVPAQLRVIVTVRPNMPAAPAPTASPRRRPPPP